MNTVVYQNGIRYNEKQFNKEADLERLVVDNATTLFGKNSIYVDVKKKLANDTFGGVIPDGFLFVLNDLKNPEFYIVEVELSKHSFFNHIFPQITKFFAFFKNSDSQSKLIDNIYGVFDSDDELKKELKSKIGNRETYKFLKDTIEDSQNILLVIDEEKKELPEIIETYTDTWGKMVKLTILKEYITPQMPNSILTLRPDFEQIEFVDIITKQDAEETSKSVYDEKYHLDGTNEKFVEIYQKLKAEIVERIPGINFNSQRYYISLRKKRNFAIIQFRKKFIDITAFMPEEIVRQRIKFHDVQTLGEGVQKFYNNPCARIVVVDDRHLDEIIDLFVEIQK